MVENNIKEKKLRHPWQIMLSDEQKVFVAKKGLRPEHVRHFIETYSKGQGIKRLPSGDWQELRSIISRTPSLQLTGDINSGKTYLVRSLIKNDRDHIYIVLDAHQEFTFLPDVNNITPDIKHSVRIKLPEAPQGSIGMFSVYYNLIMNNQFPKHFVLVIEEALRYKDVGIKNLLAEARKFLYVLAITQEKLVDFCPCIEVEPYNHVRL
jgi:hypothetical protein